MPDIVYGELDTLREECRAKLQAATGLVKIPFLTERKGDIEDEIKRSLGYLQPADGQTAVGICAILVTPVARNAASNSPGPLFEDVTLVVRIVESVAINQATGGTLLSCLYVAERVACGPLGPDGKTSSAGLHLFTTSQNKTLVCSMITIVPDQSENGNLIYDVVFKTAL